MPGRKPFRITVDPERFLAAIEALPELYLGAGGFLSECNCAATPPTMPTYRTVHLDTCPVAGRDWLTDYWFAHYVSESGHCSLCGNHGVIDTSDTPGGWTPAGLHVGRRNFCICPNGQALRAASTPTPKG